MTLLTLLNPTPPQPVVVSPTTDLRTFRAAHPTATVVVPQPAPAPQAVPTTELGLEVDVEYRVRFSEDLGGGVREYELVDEATGEVITSGLASTEMQGWAGVVKAARARRNRGS